MKNIRVFLSENFQFLDMKFSIYLNRHFFVMLSGAMKMNIAAENSKGSHKPMHLQSHEY